MMVNPNPKLVEMHDILINWWALDDQGNHTLKEDAPPEIVKMNEEFDRLFVH